jgi:hypothetical protein
MVYTLTQSLRTEAGTWPGKLTMSLDNLSRPYLSKILSSMLKLKGISGFVEELTK